MSPKLMGVNLTLHNDSKASNSAKPVHTQK